MKKQFIKELLAGYSDPAQITGAIPGCIGHGILVSQPNTIMPVKMWMVNLLLLYL